MNVWKTGGAQAFGELHEKRFGPSADDTAAGDQQRPLPTLNQSAEVPDFGVRRWVRLGQRHQVASKRGSRHDVHRRVKKHRTVTSLHHYLPGHVNGFHDVFNGFDAAPEFGYGGKGAIWSFS